MANTFYYKIDGDTLYYSDINEDGTWTEESITNKTRVPSNVLRAQPFRENVLIELTGSEDGLFSNGNYTYIDFSGFTFTSGSFTRTFENDFKLEHLILGNTLGEWNSDWPAFANVGRDSQKLTIEFKPNSVRPTGEFMIHRSQCHHIEVKGTMQGNLRISNDSAVELIDMREFSCSWARVSALPKLTEYYLPTFTDINDSLTPRLFWDMGNNTDKGTLKLHGTINTPNLEALFGGDTGWGDTNRYEMLDISDMHFPQPATSVSLLINNFNNLKSVDLSNITCADGCDIFGMIRGCPSLSELILPQFLGEKSGTYMIIHSGSNEVPELKIKGDISNMHNIAGLFAATNAAVYNHNYKILDFSNLTFSYFRDISNAFSGNASVTTIKVMKDFVSDKTVYIDGTFYGLDKLVGGQGSAPSTYGTSGQYAKIDGGSENPGYFTKGMPEYSLIMDILPSDEVANIKYRTERDEIVFDIEILDANYEFSYFYYKLPSGEYSDKITNIARVRIPLAGAGSYTAFFRFSKKDPYEDDPDKDQTDGGEGSFDDSSDKNPVPENPNSYITLRGAPFNSYYLTPEDVIKFGEKLFQIPHDYLTLAEEFIKMFGGNPIDSIITYHTVPVIPSFSGRGGVYYANSFLNFDAYIIDNEFVNVDFGSISVKEYYGNFLDYETKAEIYLPFIGYQQLNIEDIMNETTVEVVYHINVITGALMAYIVCGGDVRYQFSGNCKEEMPLTAASNNILSVGLSAISGAVVGATTGGAGAAALGAFQGMEPIKQQVSHGSGLSSSGGMMGIMRPFLILTRPRLAAPANYGSYKGFPLNVKGRIGDYKGLTVVDTNRIKGPMTGKEKEQIEQLLKNGVKL